MGVLRKILLSGFLILGVAACVPNGTPRLGNESSSSLILIPQNAINSFLSISNMRLEKYVLTRGSGFVFDKDEKGFYALTAAHVVRDSKWVSVENSIGEMGMAFVVGRNKKNDVAVLYIPFVKGENFTASLLHIGSSKFLMPGETMYILCNPHTDTKDLRQSISGIFNRSLLPRDSSMTQPLKITFRKSVVIGCSGGPLITKTGEVVGMVVGSTPKFISAQAIPIEQAMKSVRGMSPSLK